MLCNLHTHTVFCDGENTPEEIVLSALEKGFTSIGFSGHALTDFEPFGITDLEGYIKTVNELKNKYKKDIQIYLGIEEDALSPINDRNAFDYIIGSHHYIRFDGKILPIDLSFAEYKKILSYFNNDAVSFAERYFSDFCDYILKYSPQIVGHFDLITKFDEQDNGYLLGNTEYNKLAEKYLLSVIKSGCLFEVNTGAISRGYRTSPYPAENLLYLLKKEGAGIIITSDAHSAGNIDFNFKETEKYLKDIGFTYTYVMYNNKLIKQVLR